MLVFEVDVSKWTTAGIYWIARKRNDVISGSIMLVGPGRGQ